MSRGLYIHIPFCKSRCHYCNFISEKNPTLKFRERFLNALSLEMNQIQKQCGRLEFGTVYFGGGTPSLLSIFEMATIMDGIRRRFEVSSGAEITCEWNPGDGDDGKLAAFSKLGINRISLGVQSFQDFLLVRLGRRHSVADTLRTLKAIQKAGIYNRSFDLMLKIPGQTPENFEQSLEQCIGLEASQVSLYDLEVHGETVLGRLKKEGKLDLPGEDDHARMYRTAMEKLTKAGYEHYEISNFAKPGMASRHNLIYWHNQEYLGLGPGAFSYINGVRYQFASDRERYFRKCEERDWIFDQKDILSGEEKETETFVMGLRLREGVKPSNFKKIYSRLKTRAQSLCKEGLMEEAGEKVRLTDRGRFLSEDVFRFLLRKDDVLEPDFL